MQNYTDIDPESGFSTAFSVGGPAAAWRTSSRSGAIIGILTVMFTFMLGRDPGVVLDEPGRAAAEVVRQDAPDAARADPGDLDRRAVVSAVIAGFLPIGEAAELTNIGILLAFVVVCVGGDRAALPAARPAAHLPHAGHAGRAGDRAWSSRSG